MTSWTWLEALSVVGHELRRPLTVIRGTATLLIEAYDQLPPASRGEILGLMDRSVQEMSELIEDLMVAAHLEAGRLPLSMHAFEVEELVAESAAAATRLDPQRQLVIRTACPGVMVEADRTQAGRALRALLVNALRRSPTGTEVEVAVRAEPAEVGVTVLDRGPAIPEAELERIFEPLGSLNSTTSVAGLGLFLARGLARAMEGDVRASPRPGGGSAFSFTLNRRV